MIRRFIPLALGAAVVALAGQAHADTTPFASFALLSPSFVYTGTQSGGTLTVTNAPVIFTYGGYNGIPTTFFTDAVFNLSGTVGPSNNNNNLNAAFLGYTATFTSAQGVNLLSVAAGPGASTAGRLNANGGSGGASGSTSSGDSITFSSAVLSFSNATERAYSFTFSGINPNVSNGTPAGFTASGTGNFASNNLPSAAAAPEPGAFALVGMAGLPLLGLVRRRNAGK